MMLNQPWESGWCINEEKLDVKWMACNPAPEEVVVFFCFFLSYFLITRFLPSEYS